MCLKDRIKDEESSESDLLTRSLKLLATHGWEKTGDASFGYSAIESLNTRFVSPLQEAGVNCDLRNGMTSCTMLSSTST